MATVSASDVSDRDQSMTDGWPGGLNEQACPLGINVNVNVNVSVYSLKSPLSSADFTIYASGIVTLSYTVSSPLGRIQHLRTLLQL